MGFDLMYKAGCFRVTCEYRTTYSGICCGASDGVLQKSDAQYAPQPTSSDLGSCWVVQADVELVIHMLLACCKLSILGLFSKGHLLVLKKEASKQVHTV